MRKVNTLNYILKWSRRYSQLICSEFISNERVFRFRNLLLDSEKDGSGQEIGIIATGWQSSGADLNGVFIGSLTFIALCEKYASIKFTFTPIR